MIVVRIVHKLSREDARRRLEALAQREGIELDLDPGGFSGTVQKKVPLVGKARAGFVIEEVVLVVRVLEAPKFLSEATLRRTLEDELGRAFA